MDRTGAEGRQGRPGRRHGTNGARAKGDKGDAGTNGTNGPTGTELRATRATKAITGGRRSCLSRARRRQPDSARQRVEHLGRVVVNGGAWNNALSLVVSRRRRRRATSSGRCRSRPELGHGGHPRQRSRCGHPDLLARWRRRSDRVDAYAAAIELNASGMISSITVATSGMHTLRVRTDAPRTRRRRSFYGYLVWLRLVKQ